SLRDAGYYSSLSRTRPRTFDQRLFPSRKSSTREPPVDLQCSKERGQRTHCERAHGPQGQVSGNSRLAGHAWNGRDRLLQSCQHTPSTKSRQPSQPDDRPVSGGSRGTDGTTNRESCGGALHESSLG